MNQKQLISICLILNILSLVLSTILMGDFFYFLGSSLLFTIAVIFLIVLYSIVLFIKSTIPKIFFSALGVVVLIQQIFHRTTLLIGHAFKNGVLYNQNKMGDMDIQVLQSNKYMLLITIFIFSINLIPLITFLMDRNRNWLKGELSSENQ